jgi:hypothetical protein
MVLGIHLDGDTHLMEIADADGLPTGVSRPSERWQDQAREDRNDRDDHQKLDQRECR